MDLVTSLLYGAGAALPLVVGTAVGVTWRPRADAVAAMLAFASGALLTGLAFELFEPAFETAGLALAGGGLVAGTGAYVAVDYALERRDAATGVALLATVIFDGLSENLTLGVVLVGSPSEGPLAILAGIAANNFPEAIGGGADMVESGWSPRSTLAVWTATATGLALAVVAGYAVFAAAGEATLALVRALGGGAILASLADEIMPVAYEDGGPAVAFATATGFVAAFALV